MRTALRLTLVCTALLTAIGGAIRGAEGPDWNARGAAGYLDGQMASWATWPNAQRDHGTFCVSCHTAAPYALARPALAKALGDTAPPAAAQTLFANVATRVQKWNEVAPFYADQRNGLPKTSESRGTEAVLNALLLASRDSQSGTLGADTRTAFGHMWGLQMRTGPLDGAWAWLNFRYEPWEADGGAFFGAAMAVAAVGAAPGNYRTSEDAATGVERLTKYVAANFGKQNLFNQLTMIAAASKVEGLVSAEQRAATAAAVAALQQADGGWSISQLGTFARVDKTPVDTAPDGYGTALAVLGMRLAGTPAHQSAAARGIAWLRTHQDTDGRWRATSLNKHRDPASYPARFMNDAATAYAALALTTAE